MKEGTTFLSAFLCLSISLFFSVDFSAVFLFTPCAFLGWRELILNAGFHNSYTCTD